jgi:heat shock transcription factor
VGWSDSRDSFVVWKPVEFASEVLPQYFKHNNFCSFIRQLNTYGFHKVDGKQWEFKHELFRDGNPQLLKEIQRRKAKKRGTEKDDFPETPEHVAHAAVTPSPQPTPVQVVQPQQQQLLPIKSEPVAKLKKVDHDESYEKEEVDKLRDLNQLLMKEVVKLQQQQESTMDVINQIMEQLMESKKEQHKLHKKVAQMSKELPEGSVSLITPPPSPLHPGLDDAFQRSILSPPFFNMGINSDYSQLTIAPQVAQVKPSPAIQYVSTQPAQARQNPQPTVTKPDPNSFAYLQVEDPSLLALDDLAHLELTPSIEQELAKLLQNTLSPPQSPQYQPNY